VAVVHDFRLQRWGPELRRVMMKVRPEYFSWSGEERERYGVNIPDEDSDRLDQVLLEQVFGRKYRSAKAAANAVRRMPLQDLNRWNATRLPLTGIGEDHFYLNESLAKGQTLLDFPTMLNYDQADYRFQQQALREQNQAYCERPYRGCLYSRWARLFVGEAFTYATLSVAAGYITDEFNEIASDIVHACIPHKHVRGKNYGKTEGDFWHWDMRADADGKEELLDELWLQTYAYIGDRSDALLTLWDELARCGVYIIDSSEPPEANMDFVFTDTWALGAVRFRSFLQDCRAIERSAGELNQMIDEEKKRLSEFIHAKHQELLKRFDPKVARLRKRRKILMHKNALDDLA